VSRVVDAMAIALAGSKSRQQAESVEEE